MTWSNAPRSDRALRLPSDWARRQRRVLVRDQQQCQLRYDGCIGHATDVDHDDTGLDDLDDLDDLDHLRAACRPCHNQRTASQGVAARGRIAASRHRPVEPPPGLVARPAIGTGPRP